jgi:hypothetical protein
VKTAAELVDTYSRAYESVGGHPNRNARALGIAAVIDLLADDVDSGPTFPVPPGVISALLREKAEDLRQDFGPAARVDRDGPE